MIFSWGKKVLEVGSMKADCQKCQRERNHRVSLVYSYLEFNYLFTFVGEKRYFLQCVKCRSELEADPAAVRAVFPRIRIPIINWGSMLFLVVGLAIAFAVAIAIRR